MSFPQNKSSISGINNADNSKSSFAALLDSFENKSLQEGTVAEGTIVAIRGDKVIINAGLKSEGRLNLDDVKSLKGTDDIKVGDTIEVYIERLEDRHGEPVLSIEKAQKEAVWKRLEHAKEHNEVIEGFITGRTKGGFSVDIGGTNAFLPGSQVDIRLVQDIAPLLNNKLQFLITKMDRARNNIVVSRRAVLEIARNAAREEIMEHLEIGMEIDNATVKNITDYGAFVDIGGIDALLHVTDMSWKRISSPSDVVSTGDKIKVKVLKFNKESGRISVGIKQLVQSPWENGIEEKFKIGEKYKGKIVNITEYGAFVELDDSIEGMIYKNELSWSRETNPMKLVSIGDEVEVKVLAVNAEKHKISLSLKECQPNPCVQFAQDHEIGSTLKGTIKDINEFGIFVEVAEDLQGTIANRDINWDISYDGDIDKVSLHQDSKAKNFEIGQEIEVKLIGVEPAKEIIRLGIKQLTEDPYKSAFESVHKDDVVKGKISKIGAYGMVVVLDNGLPCLLSNREKGYDKGQVFNEGDEIEALVIRIEPNYRNVELSIRALQDKTEKEVLKKLNSEKSKSTLGDVLGDAIK